MKEMSESEAGIGDPGGPEQSVDLRGQLASVRDQGERPTCLAFAVTSAHELARSSRVDEPDDLSEEALYWGCKTVDGQWQPGTSFLSAATALAKWGQPTEDVWPYDQDRDDSMAYAPPSGVEPGDGWFRGELTSVELDLDVLRRFLAEGRVVVIGILLTSGFFDPDDGEIPEPEVDESLWGGHAVVVAGFADPGDSDQLIIQNSWGSDWGDGGYAFLPYSYFKRFTREAWVIEAATHPGSD